MPNKNYVRGRNKEYRICKELRDAGYTIVQRTAGSHSPFDVIAVHKENRSILFVQAKPDTYTRNQVDKILREMEWLDGEFNVEFDVE